jgi:Fe-S-cluster containining protein
MFNMKVVQTSRLDLDTRFKFRCYKGIECFTKCCSNIDIMLTPYDVLRMKNRLGMSSEEFIVNHTVKRVDEKSSHPYAYLRMEGGKERKCPFVTFPDGCKIYTDRPVSCRYYPVGQASLKKGTDEGEIVFEEFYFFVREKHCVGYQEDTEWTIASWREDQGSEHFDSMNREWKEVLMRRNLPGNVELDPKKQDQFFMASYDLDRFRRFVFESRFLEIFDIQKDEIDKVKESEVDLMKLAFKYIKYIMMIEETLKVNKAAMPDNVGEDTSTK